MAAEYYKPMFVNAYDYRWPKKVSHYQIIKKSY